MEIDQLLWPGFLDKNGLFLSRFPVERIPLNINVLVIMAARTGNKTQIDDNDSQIKDKYHVISILFFFMGLVNVLPWTFFLAANEYWMYKFRDTSIEFEQGSKNKTSLQYSFSAVLSIALTIAHVIFLFLCMLFGHRFNVKFRAISSLLGILILIVVGTILVPVNTDDWQLGFFILTMAIIAGINAMNSIFGMTIFTILSNFPKSNLGPYMIGQGIGAIFVSAIQILSLSAKMSVQNNALLYFCLGIAVNVIACIMLVAAQTNRFYVQHMSKFENGKKEKVVNFKEFLRLSGKIWPVTATLAFWILADVPVHPSVTSLVQSENAGNGNAWNDVYFKPTITFLMVAVGSAVGTVIATQQYKYFKNINEKFVVLFSVLRMFIFIPLLLLCNAQPRHLPLVFPHDYQYIIIMICISISSGYLMCMCSFMIPGLVTPEELNNAYQVYMVTSGIMLGVGSFSGYISLLIL